MERLLRPIADDSARLIHLPLSKAWGQAPERQGQPRPHRPHTRLLGHESVAFYGVASGHDLVAPRYVLRAEHGTTRGAAVSAERWKHLGGRWAQDRQGTSMECLRTREL
jgi:hypothetical protein